MNAYQLAALLPRLSVFHNVAGGPSGTTAAADQVTRENEGPVASWDFTPDGKNWNAALSERAGACLDVL